MNKTYGYVIDFDANLKGYIVLRRQFPISNGSEILTEQAGRPWVKIGDMPIPPNYVYGTPRAAALALTRWTEGGNEGGTTDKGFA